MLSFLTIDVQINNSYFFLVKRVVVFVEAATVDSLKRRRLCCGEKLVLQTLFKMNDQ